jgi:internalin A
LAVGIGYSSGKVVSAMIDQTVSIPDPTLKKAIQNNLNIHGQDIRASDMARINRLEIFNNGSVINGHTGDAQITELTGLEYCINIESIRLNGQNIRDLSPLRNLTGLQTLVIDGCVQDVTPLANLTNLKTLIIMNNSIRDITALANLTDLQDLGLMMNQIYDITPLKNLHKLTNLALDDNKITDITALSDLLSLNQLGLSRNEISDLDPLVRLDQIYYLNAFDNHIIDITALARLYKLENLRLSNNNIRDISALARLYRLENLYLDDNDICDLSPLLINKGFIDSRVNRNLNIVDNPLNADSVNICIAALEACGIEVSD